MKTKAKPPFYSHRKHVFLRSAWKAQQNVVIMPGLANAETQVPARRRILSRADK